MIEIPNSFNKLVDRYSQYRDEDIYGRYLPYSFIESSLRKVGEEFPLVEIGNSLLGEPIHTITIGNGKNKILAWSQMHGNESTTTKAVFDILSAFLKFPKDPFLLFLKKHLTLKIIPMLNPDGALAYTRQNFNKTDLNRDALKLQEKESKILRAQFDNFQPHYCFNLHDQRTIFSAGNNPYPATLSFLTPSMNSEREILPSRKISMKIIASIAADLSLKLPNQIGRYDDSYNSNCTGDTFQSKEVPTILFEAGHYKEDYEREQTRKFVAIALFSAMKTISMDSWKSRGFEEYFEIPENQKLFYDVIFRQAKIDNEIKDVAIQFKEELVQNRIVFQPEIKKIAVDIKEFGHKEIFCEEEELKAEGEIQVRANVIVHKFLLKDKILAINY